MTEKQKERVDALLATAKKCEAGGIRIGLPAYTGYCLLFVSGQKTLQNLTPAEARAALETKAATLYASDKERLWKEPRMVLELDVFAPEIVTRRYCLKGIKRAEDQVLPSGDIVPAEALRGAYIVPADVLPEIMDPAEVVIYDHTRQIKGRAAREVMT